MNWRKSMFKASPWLTTISFFLIWEILCRLLKVPPFVLPAPSQAVAALIPKVAVVPILVLWFGIGTPPAVITAFLVAFFPISVNVATGIATTEPELEDVLRSLGASKFDVLYRVGLPRSLPYFFASLKIAITLAFVGSVISETVASNQGIGYLMMAASSTFRVPLVFAALFVIAAMGIGMHAIAALFERRHTRWAVRTLDRSNFAAEG